MNAHPSKTGAERAILSLILLENTVSTDSSTARKRLERSQMKGGVLSAVIRASAVDAPLSALVSLWHSTSAGRRPRASLSL